MVKGISRRVVVVNAPDRRLFEQAIFIVRNDAVGVGVSSQELVEEARRVAEQCAGSGFRMRRRWMMPVGCALLGAGGCCVGWLILSALI